MDKAIALQIINEAQTNKFCISYKNGQRKKIRLFIYHNDTICYHPYRVRKYGYPLSDQEIESWRTLEKEHVDEIYVQVRKFMESVVRYLTHSGLWEDIRKDYEKILEQGDDYLKHVLSLGWDSQRDYMRQTIGATFHVDSIIRSARKGIISINYFAEDKHYLRDKAHDAIRNNKEFSYSWRKKYDNSVEFRVAEDGKKRGWYSEEYKNCGNGHYYLALDEKRAIFYEDD